jgi:hypothetical protein
VIAQTRAIAMPMKRYACLLAIPLLSCAIAQAARPFVTDDARMVDAGGCQLETFAKRQKLVDEREFWLLPACNPWGGVELTLGGTRVEGSVPGDSRTTILQAKTLIKTLQTNGTGYALTLGMLQTQPYRRARADSFYVNAIASASYADDRVVLHANLGAIDDRAAGMRRATWGVGAEIALGSRLYGIAESYGQHGEKPTMHVGLRVWLVPNRVQVDGTLGHQQSGPPERRFQSVGLRVLF